MKNVLLNFRHLFIISLSLGRLEMQLKTWNEYFRWCQMITFFYLYHDLILFFLNNSLLEQSITTWTWTSKTFHPSLRMGMMIRLKTKINPSRFTLNPPTKHNFSKIWKINFKGLRTLLNLLDLLKTQKSERNFYKIFKEILKSSKASTLKSSSRKQAKESRSKDYIDLGWKRPRKPRKIGAQAIWKF